MEEKILISKQQFNEMLSNVKENSELENLRILFLGKKGEITELMQGLRDLPAEDRKQAGQTINNFKQYVESLLEQRLSELKQLELLERINKAERIDITVPSCHKAGSLHPITIVQKEVE